MRDIFVDRAEINNLNNLNRVKLDDLSIVEKVWIHVAGDLKKISACYIKRWYHIVPNLRLMTNLDNIVEEERT